MDIARLIAIDTHVHPEVSCCQPPDLFGKELDDAADKYFGTVLKQGRRPTIPETIEFYRERRIGMVMFTVDCEAQLGRRRIPNDFQGAGFQPEVHSLILKENAISLLDLPAP